MNVKEKPLKMNKTAREPQMTERDISYGQDGTGRDFTNSDGQKVTAGAITSSVEIDNVAMQEVREKWGIGNSDQRPLGWLPALPGWADQLQPHSLAFHIDGHDGVVQYYNGFEIELVEEYPDDPELVRQLMRARTKPAGWPIQTGDVDGTKIALQISGLRTVGTPAIHNYGPVELESYALSKNITHGCLVTVDCPNLKEPRQYGNPKGGFPPGEVRPLLRAADTTSIADMIITMQGAFNQDAAKFKRIAANYTNTISSWPTIISTINDSYNVAALVFVETCLRRGFLTVPDDRNELRAARGEPALTSFDVVVRMAEYMGLLGPSAIATAALGARRGEYIALHLEATQRMLPAPHATTRAYNRETQFGYVPNEENGGGAFLGRVGGRADGAIKTDNMGRFYAKTLDHHRAAYQCIAKAAYIEHEKSVGVAHGTPSPAGESKFPLFIALHGSVYPHNC